MGLRVFVGCASRFGGIDPDRAAFPAALFPPQKKGPFSPPGKASRPDSCFTCGQMREHETITDLRGAALLDATCLPLPLDSPAASRSPLARQREAGRAKRAASALPMKTIVLLLIVLLIPPLLFTGCALPVPKTSLHFDPATKTLDIRSPKDVKMAGVTVDLQGTNFSLTIDSYESANNLAVVKAAAQAQAEQIAGSLKAGDRILQAVGK
jgi:hypothetical protein